MSRSKTIHSIAMTPQTQNNSKQSQLSQLSESSVHQTLYMSDYYSCDPLHSNYSCFACLKRKKGSQSMVRTHSRKKRNLSFAKTDDIIIKPWHPFLRILQGFFKSDRSKILNKYQQEDNKLVVEFIQCLRALRTQLISSQELICQVKTLALSEENQSWQTQLALIESINTTIEENSQVLSQHSLEIIENHFQSSSLNQPPPMKLSLRTQILEQQLRNANFLLKEQEKSLDLISNNVSPPLKPTIQQLLDLQKHLNAKNTELEQLKIDSDLYRKEYSKLKEENYFLYSLVRLDRHQLFLNLMKQYPQELLQETEVSYFELYLQQMETQVAELRIAKARNTALIRKYDAIEQDQKKDVEGVVANEQRRLKDIWGMEKDALIQDIENLQNELKRAERTERELTGNCMKQQNESQQLVLHSKILSDQVNQMSEQILNLRKERDLLLRQLDLTQQSLKNMEQSQLRNSNIPEIQAKMQEGSAQAVLELCYIILSKQPHLSSEQGEMIRKYFGESAQTVIDQYEAALGEQRRNSDESEVAQNLYQNF